MMQGLKVEKQFFLKKALFQRLKFFENNLVPKA